LNREMVLAAAATALLLTTYVLTDFRTEFLLAAAATALAFSTTYIPATTYRRSAAWPRSRAALATLAAQSATSFISTAANAYLRPDPAQATLILALNTYLLARVYAEGFHSLRDDGGLLASVTGARNALLPNTPHELPRGGSLNPAAALDLAAKTLTLASTALYLLGYIDAGTFLSLITAAATLISTLIIHRMGENNSRSCTA
jgi:hypothetical protein